VGRLAHRQPAFEGLRVESPVACSGRPLRAWGLELLVVLGHARGSPPSSWASGWKPRTRPCTVLFSQDIDADEDFFQGVAS